MPVAKLTSRGTLPIPAEYRKKYNLRPGDELNIIDYGGMLSIAPVPHDPIRFGYGLLKGGHSLTEALLRSRAEERRLEDRKFARLYSGKRARMKGVSGDRP